MEGIPGGIFEVIRAVILKEIVEGALEGIAEAIAGGILEIIVTVIHMEFLEKFTKEFWEKSLT